jgi:hypothetical protein
VERILLWQCVLNYSIKVVWHIPAETIHSSATYHTVNSRFEQVTARPCSLELPSVGVEGRSNVDSLQLMFDCPWIFCATRRSLYNSQFHHQILFVTSWEFQ